MTARAQSIIWSVAVLLFVSAALFVYYGSDLSDMFAPRNDGHIIVNSPSIYTRQRLVNDRLEHSAWLKDQLKVTLEQLKQFQAINEVRSEILSRILKAKLSASTTSEGNTEKSVADLKPSGLIEQTTVDAFHAMNSYREEVRSEMMQTLLDDRHDIQGNTIYRLAFQTSVLSGLRERDLALITVKLIHDPSKFSSDYADVYNDWMRY